MTKEKIKKNYCVTLDDDPVVPLVIERMLKIQIVPFVSARKLLARATSFDPIAAFIDIHLGTEESGIHILRELRKIWSHRPLIVITSDPNPKYISQALALGANDYLRKPLEVTELRARTTSRILELQERQSRDTIACGDVVLVKSLNLVKGPLGARHLSPSETLLLERLFVSPGVLISKAELKAQIWGSLKVTDNTVDRRVFVLRRCIEDVSIGLKLKSHYGKGVAVEPVVLGESRHTG